MPPSHPPALTVAFPTAPVPPRRNLPTPLLSVIIGFLLLPIRAIHIHSILLLIHPPPDPTGPPHHPSSVPRGGGEGRRW
eukprot:164645-Pyramimonas_sp.AAC.1